LLPAEGFLLGILIFKGLTARRLYKSFGVKGLKRFGCGYLLHVDASLYPRKDCLIFSRVSELFGMRLAGYVARMGEESGVHSVLLRKPEGKRSLGRPRRRWEDNIKMDLQEVGGGCGDWLRALVSTVKKTLWFRKNAVNFLTSCKLVSFSRRTLLRGVSK
jgi:hypothetical protein